MKRALWLGLAVVMAAGCGGGDDDGGGGRRGADLRFDNMTRFESPRIPFTFDYSEDFAAEKHPGGGVLASVGLERGSRLNAIKVRRTANRELGPERYLDEFQRDFERTVGTVQKRKERIGKLNTGVLEFEDSVKRGGKTVDFTSSSYFFTGAGRTWQMECIADDEHRPLIGKACRIALESVDFAD